MAAGTQGHAQVGRVMLPADANAAGRTLGGGGAVFAHTGHALRLVERAAVCVKAQEPLLLVRGRLYPAVLSNEMRIRRIRRIRRMPPDDSSHLTPTMWRTTVLSLSPVPHAL